jgi:cytochrome c oxidase accessory protein FixG
MPAETPVAAGNYVPDSAQDGVTVSALGDLRRHVRDANGYNNSIMAAIDLTSRIIQPSAPPARPSSLRWHPWRRLLQVLCGVVLVVLPLTNGMCADMRAGVLYVGWHRMAIGNVMSLFWIGMLGLWLLVTVSFLYGRLWCGWICPQTLASDFADSLKGRLDKAFHVRPASTPRGAAFIASRTIWTALLLAVSVGTGMTLACYWIDPTTVWRSSVNPSYDATAAIVVYVVAAVILADMLWLRRKFCSSLCPYGAMIGVLADKNTLAVRYLSERDDDCIHCGKCEVDCPMGIDIKQGVGQYDCIGCGECVDSCNDVLGKRGKLGLIEYRFGVEPDRQTRSLTALQRIGLWDNRRWGVVATLGFFALATGLSIFGRVPTAADATADGAIVKTAGQVRDTYTLRVDNGSPDPQSYFVTLSGLPKGSVETPSGAIVIDGRGSVSIPLTLCAPAAECSPGRRTLVQVTVASAHDHVKIPLIFYTPAK